MVRKEISFSGKSEDGRVIERPSKSTRRDMEDDGGLLILLFSPHLLWCVFLVCSSFSAVVCFFFLPYFVGFQLFGLIVAKEGQ